MLIPSSELGDSERFPTFYGFPPPPPLPSPPPSSPPPPPPVVGTTTTTTSTTTTTTTTTTMMTTVTQIILGRNNSIIIDIINDNERNFGEPLSYSYSDYRLADSRELRWQYGKCYTHPPWPGRTTVTLGL
ncbi:hypothetical protein V1478_001045 [Vespula squamosa]|uniref:Uncharacterized protein n=1 Tax=Vespula squamosa TaxID=30214 RepID=A0ABD2C776_VESSQ